MRLANPFWYESNACWGNVSTLEDLNEKLTLQLESGAIPNVDEFLDRSRQNICDINDFGTRSEHSSKQTLREFLIKQDFDIELLQPLRQWQ